MMRAVAVVVFFLSLRVHGQSTSPALDSLPVSETTPMFAASNDSALSSSEIFFSTVPSVANIASTTARSSTPESSSYMTSSDAQPPTKVTSTKGSIEGDGSPTTALVSSADEMSARLTTLSNFMFTHVSVTTDSHPLPSAPSVTFTPTRAGTPTGTTTATQPPLSPTEFQLAIALPASVFGCICLLMLLVLIVFACRTWRRRKCKDRVDDYSAVCDGTETATVFGNKGVENETEAAFKPKPMRLTYRPKIPVMSHPLTIAELGALVQNEESIANEFANIPSNMVTMDDIPSGAEAKNRYGNVLPNPHTKVPLFLKFGVANSDYVNANYIRGYTGVPRAFIATQGPLLETTPDFWRMVWEQRSSIIVMLTELEENNLIKCHRYWPDEPEGRTTVYDDIEVTLAKRMIENHYTTTTFLLRHLEKRVTREVIHIWFRAWPDHGAPEVAEPFLNFIQTFRSVTAELPVGPVIVNCSAGIGRSGVFIASCLGVMSLEDSGEVDILKLVSTMRQDRGGMVQSRTQYIFLHKALHQYGLWLERERAPTSTFVVKDAPRKDEALLLD